LDGDNSQDKGLAISMGMKRHHEKRRAERIKTGNLCKRDKYRIAIENLHKGGMTDKEITG